jgi:hypothetical protein
MCVAQRTSNTQPALGSFSYSHSLTLLNHSVSPSPIHGFTLPHTRILYIPTSTSTPTHTPTHTHTHTHTHTLSLSLSLSLSCSLSCALSNGASLSHKYLSLWDVSMNSTYGQYALCNVDKEGNWACTGGNLDSVGREAPAGLVRPAAGQCTAHPEVGEWFSLPDQCQCSSDQR